MVVVEPRVRRHGTCKADKINKPITTGSPSHVLVMAAFIYSLFLAFQTEQVLDSVDTETTDQQLAHQHQPSSPDEAHSVRDAPASCRKR